MSNIIISKDENIVTGVFSKDEIYIVVSNCASKAVKVKKLSKVSKDWEDVFDFEDRICFCASTLIDKIYFIGGEDENQNNLNSCIQFDTKNKITKQVGKTE